VLKELHHRILVRSAVCETYMADRDISASNGDIEEDPDSSGNHIILIIPVGQDVFELDGNREEPTYLGRVKRGMDWRLIALDRLRWLSDAAFHTGVHNDIHAVLKEDLD